MALLFVVGRFRLPVTPALIFFGALTADRLLGLLNDPEEALREMKLSLEVDSRQPDAHRARELIRRLEEKVAGDPSS